MSTSRPLFIKLMEDAFKDPTTKATCVNSIKNKLTTRIFDDFPELLPPAMTKTLSDDFTKIIPRISLSTKPGDHKETHMSSTNQNAIDLWGKKIARIGCQELINKQTKSICNDILKLLEWDKDTSKIKTTDIICAYLARISASILCNSSAYLQKNQAAAFTAITYINRNYHVWVSEELKKFDIAFEFKPEPSNPPLISTSKFTKTAISIGILGGIIAASGVIYATFFNKSLNVAPAPHSILPDKKIEHPDKKLK